MIAKTTPAIFIVFNKEGRAAGVDLRMCFKCCSLSARSSGMLKIAGSNRGLGHLNLPGASFAMERMGNLSCCGGMVSWEIL
jgi:hypothetical protein